MGIYFFFRNSKRLKKIANVTANAKNDGQITLNTLPRSDNL